MKLPILLYHKIAEIPAGVRYPKNYVTPRQFDAQLTFLALRGYHTITFDQYLAYRDGSRTSLPRKPVIITLDDGYLSNRSIAVPILQRHGFSATIFLVARQIGKTNAWDADELQEPLLDVPDIRALQAAGIDFQSHTLTHPRLTQIPQSAALEELSASRAELAQLLGRPVSVLCYPYGDWNQEIAALARQAGYRAAVIIRRRMNQDTVDPFALRRIPIKYLTSFPRFVWDLTRLRWFRGS